MELIEILSDKSIKKTEARKRIIDGIVSGDYTIEAICDASSGLEPKKIATILETIEEISNKRLMCLGLEYLEFAIAFVSGNDNSCKREASRIIGNMAGQFPQTIEEVIPALLENAHAEGTVVRWGSAYALSRIIVLDEYCNSELYDTLVSICDDEQENGVKNQYVKAFKKVDRNRVST